MSYSITVTHDRALSRKALNRFVFARMGMLTLIGIPAVGIFLLWVLFAGTWDIVCSVLAVLYLACVSTLGFVYSLRRRQSEGFFALARNPTVHYTFDDDGVRTESELGVSVLKWPMFNELVTYPDVCLLIYAKSAYMTFPAEALGQELRQFIEAKLR